MSPTLILIAVAVIVVGFIVILLYDGPAKKKRRDDRDKAKAEDIKQDPALLYESQQPAELLVDEDREEQPASPFAPDANNKAAKPLTR